jgi:hypothetical protein
VHIMSGYSSSSSSSSSSISCDEAIERNPMAFSYSLRTFRLATLTVPYVVNWSSVSSCCLNDLAKSSVLSGWINNSQQDIVVRKFLDSGIAKTTRSLFFRFVSCWISRGWLRLNFQMSSTMMGFPGVRVPMTMQGGKSFAKE